MTEKEFNKTNILIIDYTFDFSPKYIIDSETGKYTVNNKKSFSIERFIEIINKINKIFK